MRPSTYDKRQLKLHKVLKQARKIADSINNNLWANLENALGGRWFEALPQELEAAKKLKLKSFSWVFTVTSIGTKVEVMDEKGKRHDVTDYNTW